VASHQALLLRLQQTGGNRTVQRLLQRAASGAAPRSPAAPSLGAVGTTDEDNLAARLRSAPGGEALPPGVQQQLEHGLGADLSRVRVHTDAEADRLARAVDATAFTTGADIFFRARTYDPGSAEGMHLLAHEATHTVQQAAGPVAGRPAGGGVAISDPGDPFEQEANQAASRAMAPAQVSAQSAADPGHGAAPSAAATSPAVIQRAPGGATPKPRAPTFDEIAQALGPSLGGPYADYAAFAATMVSGDFLGHPIARGVHPEFLKKLQAARTTIDAEYKASGNPVPAGYGIASVGGFRSKAGPHAWGLAIDIDVAGNPFVMHEGAARGLERTLDAQLVPVYHRIAELMLNSPVAGEQSIIPTIITQSGTSMTGASQPRRDRLGDYYDRLATESKAMQDYFALMQDPDPGAITTFLSGRWKTTHPSATAPSADAVRRQMWEDFATLGGRVPKGGPAGVPGFTAPGPIDSGADRPFAPNSSPTPRDPGAGFLSIPREVVLGLGQTVSRWGAIDFGGESGDVQHFDDMGGLGSAIATATAQARKKIAATGPTAATEAPEDAPGADGQGTAVATAEAADGGGGGTGAGSEVLLQTQRATGASVRRGGAASGGGTPLPPGVRRQSEPAVGGGRSGARPHTDPEADRLARAVDTVASTSGAHELFRGGSSDQPARAAEADGNARIPGRGDGLRPTTAGATLVLQRDDAPAPAAPAPALPSAEELTTRIARCIGIWETNRGKDEPAPQESRLDTVAGVKASMATIEQATMPYAITALKGHKTLRDKADPPLTSKDLNDAEARCIAVSALLNAVAGAAAKGTMPDDFIKDNAAAVTGTGLSADDVKTMFDAVALKSTIDTLHADVAAKKQSTQEAVKSIPEADRLGVGEGSLSAFINDPRKWGENKAAWQRQAVNAMPGDVGKRIESVATSESGAALASAVVRTRVDAQRAKQPVPGEEEIVKAVGQQNNPGEADYGENIWKTYHRLYLNEAAGKK
jgi:hypothetical protein